MYCTVHQPSKSKIFGTNLFVEQKGILMHSIQVIVFFFLAAYLSSYHDKAINALYELAKELPAICLPH